MKPYSETGGTLDKTALQAELEATRTAFHHLLQTIPVASWRSSAHNSAWTIKEELWHIAWGSQFMLNLIKNARRNLGLPKPPMVIANPLNALYSKIRSATATRQSIAKRYDKTHQALLAELASLDDQEWAHSVKIFGETQTMEYLFHGISHHFEEHAARIRPVVTDRQ